VYQQRPLIYSLGLNNPPRIGFTLVKSRIKTKRRREQGACRCKMAGTGFHSDVASCAQMCTADCGKPRYLDRGLPRRTYSYRGSPQLRSKVESGLPRGYFCCGKPQYLWERFAKGLFQSWQTAVFERGMPQTTEFQYLSFYIGSSPLCCVINFCRATFQVLRGELFRPKLHKNGLS
jgi:hypothetical protein